MDFFQNDPDYPYRLFEIHKDFSLQELRTQYKKMVLRYHPDKNIKNAGQTKEFRILTMCYKYLLSVLKEREQFCQVSSFSSCNQNNNMNEKQFYDLKQSFDYENSQYTSSEIEQMNKNFNIEKFNREYELKKYNDPVSSKGYDHFIQDPTTLSKEKKREYANALDDISEHHGPSPIDGVDLSECYELGGKYNNLGRTNPSYSKLHFEDYKLAHTTSKIIDDRKVIQRLEYNSLDELKAERSRPIQLSPSEAERLRIIEENEKMREAERLIRLKQHEMDLSNHFQRTQRLIKR